MGKVKELAEELGKYPRLGGGFYFTREHSIELDRAEAEDAAAHAAELEAKDKRIAELQGLLDRAQAGTAVDMAEKCKLMSRIRELEAELAKRELPPLPESVREWLGKLRDMRGCAPKAAQDFVAWCDTHYPAPVPQWELDARAVERVGAAYPGSDYAAIAARIREAGRGNSK